MYIAGERRGHPRLEASTPTLPPRIRCRRRLVQIQPKLLHVPADKYDEAQMRSLDNGLGQALSHIRLDHVSGSLTTWRCDSCLLRVRSIRCLG